MFRSMVMVYRRTRTRIITELKFKQRPEIKIFGFSLILDFVCFLSLFKETLSWGLFQSYYFGTTGCPTKHDSW